MLLSRFGCCLRFALCTAALARPAWAEPSLPRPAVAEPVFAQANVVLVGAAARDLELGALLTELLERLNVHVRLTERPSFGPAELLHDPAASGAVHVFVVPGLGGNVGLYFRAPDGERFLLRSVLLRAGFDDVGREQVGQIVETAVVSLLRADPGLTREQAQLALADAVPEPVAAAPAASRQREVALAKPATPQPAAQASPAKPAGMSLDGWFALRYGATDLGTGLGLAHGPGLELGLGLERGWSLRGRVTLERDFPQTLEASLITADITSLRWRLALDAGLPLTRRQLLLLSLGAGQDRSQVEPSVAGDPNVAPAPGFQSNVPIVHAELRYEVSLARFRLAAALGADTSLARTHYDVTRSTTAEPGPERVGAPWLVRPSGAIALAFCPRWATF